MICPHCKKEIKPKPRNKVPIKIWEETSLEVSLADKIKDMIVRNHPTLKEKLNIAGNRQKAAQAIYDCRKEGFGMTKIFDICAWVCHNYFWKKQYQAVPKLTRNDNGSFGVTLKWIKRFENEMKKDSCRTAEDISRHFDFSQTFEGETK